MHKTSLAQFTIPYADPRLTQMMPNAFSFVIQPSRIREVADPDCDEDLEITDKKDCVAEHLEKTRLQAARGQIFR